MNAIFSEFRAGVRRVIVGPMLRTLIAGLGRAGWGLHLPVLTRLRDSAAGERLFSPRLPLAFDPMGAPAGQPPRDVVVIRSLAEAPDLLDPAGTVVHVCTPPAVRLSVLQELAELGFTKILVEKPLSAGPEELERLLAIRAAFGLDLVVVAPWPDSALTDRLARLVGGGELGELRGVSVSQRKPRFTRTLATNGHPSAFDVEIPHALGVALRVAGEDAEVCDAAWTDMRVDDMVIPRMGSARLTLRHGGGTRTEIFSDLTSPFRERRIDLDLVAGRVVGHYPGGGDDVYAHLRVTCGRREDHTLIHDDSLGRFFLRAYRRFAGACVADDPLTSNLTFNIKVATLLIDAKNAALRHAG